MDLNFHQTFKPEKNYLSELLQIADDADGVTLEELSNMTGIPQGKSSGKLVPHIKYACCMGLIDYCLKNSLYTLKLTDLGKEILEQDLALSEEITLLLMHSNLLKKSNCVQPWRFCFNDFYNNYGKKTKYSYFQKEVEREFGEKIKYGPFLKTYEELFSPLKLLHIISDKPYVEGSMIFEAYSLSRESLPALGYIFYDYWDEIFPNEIEITSNQLSELGFRNVFSWNETEELDALEKMSDYGLIRLNKQLMPFTVIKLKDKNDIEKSLYSELI